MNAMCCYKRTFRKLAESQREAQARASFAEARAMNTSLKPAPRGLR